MISLGKLLLCLTVLYRKIIVLNGQTNHIASCPIQRQRAASSFSINLFTYRNPNIFLESCVFYTKQPQLFHFCTQLIL